ncbi:nucleotidyl transferase AbiEii/AbiGii toxin family protein [Gelidibacter algens]|uniref:nucleotidyl transferase AbiEii/AbiGii toxin family protein n=1 Tax=Gelidibacter algens TaxID=49280 RepID=UPI0014715C31|nr:nucleotidyl transferase AbiEii/AbiGii toxin family protein [Gelidibacter algens]
MIFLEQLKLNGLEFIFKGGTALLLATKEPKRFSIDIDIITEQTQSEIETILKKISKNSAFTHWEDDNNRKHTPDAPIGHFKMYYTSVVDGNVEPILLDVLYTPNPYPELMEIPIEHDWIKTAGKITTVQMPTFDAILGDKLTAFAPKTTGILFSKNRPVEIIKQLFDVAFLMDNITDLKVVQNSYNKVVEEEIKFRKLKVSAHQVLEDTQEACFVLSTRDGNSEEFKQLQLGVSNFTNFTISRFNLEEAITAASKAAYLAEVLKNETLTKLEIFKNPSQVKDWMIENQQFNKLNKLKKSNPEAFFYWYIVVSIFVKNNLVFSSQEIKAFIVAVGYYKYRKEKFLNEEAMLQIKEKLDSNISFKSFNDIELSSIKDIIDENIEHITKVDYEGLSQDFLISRKQEILEPLFEIRKRILNFRNTQNV